MSEIKVNKTVAVITSTIGRADLVRAIESVQQQSYPCKHYVFVDGEQYHQQAKIILDKYPDVIATYLPMNTGADGWTNSSINAIAPFLAKEDIICYLDDDNWYEPNHIESGVKLLQDDSYDYAFSLRNLYNLKNEFLSPDSIESIGFYKSALPSPIELDINAFGNSHTVSLRMHKENHIDTNCFFLKKEVAITTSKNWFSGIHNDTNVWNALNDNKYRGCCTKVFTVNYTFDSLKAFNGNMFSGYSDSEKYDIGDVIISSLNEINLKKLGGIYHWNKE
ncbi:glycosyltransferase [Ursidibacter arcticus]|uniref:glycosyltransferase family 2 protein n=1 Tax=Ursidibacter arcticus TaxID=1524965 RepID=UPI0012FCF0F1|nr:glycosyltransferase family A protein [Ursidibacter arcticus]KAE9531786.1 glycosyltransferase [Ursidibacter arcticus]